MISASPYRIAGERWLDGPDVVLDSPPIFDEQPTDDRWVAPGSECPGSSDSELGWEHARWFVVGFLGGGMALALLIAGLALCDGWLRS